MIKIRTIVFASIIFIVAIFSISFKVIDLDLPGLNIKRGDSETFLGLTLGLDLKGGTHLVYEAIPNKGSELTSDDMEGARRILEKRVNSFGISESSVQLVGSGTSVPTKILVQLPGLQQINIAVTIAGQVSEKELKNLILNLGYEELKISQLEELNGRFVISGSRIKRNDGETAPAILLSELDKSYPLSMILAYTSLDDENQSVTVPTVDQVEAAASLTGENDYSIEDLSQGVFRITFPSYVPRSGDINYRFLDQAETSLLASPFEEIGSLFQASISGGISSWRISGGVEEAKKLIGETAQLEFKERDCLPVENENNEDVWPPDNLSKEEWIQVRCIIPTYYEDKAVALSGGDLIDAFPDVQPGIARPVVSIVFDDDGADEFFDITSRVAKNQDLLAIFLDGEPLVAPSASSGITGGRAYIQGPTFDSESVKTISIQLKSGALPVGLSLIQERNVDASLGSDSLRKSLIAGGAGLIFVLIFMISYYRIPGIIASLSLVFYATLLLAVFKLIPVSLTLSGAAAVILSIGVAVDANILISERTKEEIRSGRNIFSSINEGFSRAWPSIRDSNVSTIIICIVLYWFGDRFTTSVIQGFALTLGIGVIISMFTAFTISRLLMRIVSKTALGDMLNFYDPVGKVFRKKD
ncbi:MAG: protein translocase subunit SecD [Chloroflexi bacterium]|nr:protein translocase subunit SecD [Chloroflexota bacterium]